MSRFRLGYIEVISENDMTFTELNLRQNIVALHKAFPNVKYAELMRCIMILYRGHVNPMMVERILQEVMNETVH